MEMALIVNGSRAAFGASFENDHKYLHSLDPIIPGSRTREPALRPPPTLIAPPNLMPIEVPIAIGGRDGDGIHGDGDGDGDGYRR